MRNVVLAAMVCVSSAAIAQSVYPVQMLPDYRCMRLAPPGVSPASADWTRLRTRVAPSLNAAPSLMPGPVAFVRWPEVQRDGFVEVLQVNKSTAWVPVDWLRPWDGRGRCVPAVMNTGQVGAG
jgi:hypothetical protein